MAQQFQVHFTLTPLLFQNDDSSKIEECVFSHDVISTQYDVYHSVHYPGNTTRCKQRRGSTRDDDGTGARAGGGAIGEAGGGAGGGAGGKQTAATTKAVSPFAGCDAASTHGRRHRTTALRNDARCSATWYLGVDKRGAVRSVKAKAGSRPNKTFFIQRWVYEQQTVVGLRPVYQNPKPAATAARTPAPSSSPVGNGPHGRRDKAPSGGTVRDVPAFPLLSSRRKSTTKTPPRRPPLPIVLPSTAESDCGLNLLKRCDDGKPQARKPASRKKSSSLSRRQNVEKRSTGRG